MRVLKICVRRGAARACRRQISEHWRPLRLIQVDVDSLGDAVLPEMAADDRVWVEMVKRGQVVGVREVRAERGTLPLAVLEELAARFSDVTPWPYREIAEELLPTASVVVATICREPGRLARTVDALVALDYPDFEIIVVDNRSGGGEPLPEFSGGARVLVTEEPQPGISAARNRGVAAARGEFVAFTDDDVVVDREWLRVMGARFAHDTEVEAVSGLVLPAELETQPQLWFEEFYGGFSRSFVAEILSSQRTAGTDELFPYAPGRFGAGCNMAFRRSTLQRMGGFDVALGTGTPARGGEDLAMFTRLIVAGATIAFEPAALVRHTHRRTEEEFLRQVFNYGTGLTAMYTALITSDPRRLLAMVRRIPAGVRLLTRPRAQRSASLAPSYPSRALLYQALGIAYGPFAYARSAVRTWRSK